MTQKEKAPKRFSPQSLQEGYGILVTHPKIMMRIQRSYETSNVFVQKLYKVY